MAAWPPCASGSSAGSHQPVGPGPKVPATQQILALVDLSSPMHSSVINGIQQIGALSNTYLWMMLSLSSSLETDMELSKLDLKDAYKIIPVHPKEDHLSGISWRGKVFVD